MLSHGKEITLPSIKKGRASNFFFLSLLFDEEDLQLAVTASALCKKYERELFTDFQSRNRKKCGKDDRACIEWNSIFKVSTERERGIRTREFTSSAQTNRQSSLFFSLLSPPEVLISCGYYEVRKRKEYFLYFFLRGQFFSRHD